AKVAITSSPQSLRNDETGVIIGTSSLPAIDIRSHPLGANIDWSRLTDSPNMHIQESPARQVSIAAPSDEFTRVPGFVILWTNILDWLGNATDAGSFTAHPVAQLAPEWKPDSGRAMWPGFYRLSDGTTRAVNASPVHASASNPSELR